jgi:hypothetical protein
MSENTRSACARSCSSREDSDSGDIRALAIKVLSRVSGFLAGVCQRLGLQGPVALSDGVRERFGLQKGPALRSIEADYYALSMPTATSQGDVTSGFWMLSARPVSISWSAWPIEPGHLVGEDACDGGRRARFPAAQRQLWVLTPRRFLARRAESPFRSGRQASPRAWRDLRKRVRRHPRRLLFVRSERIERPTRHARSSRA